MLLPRFTTRRLMVVVAVVAVMLTISIAFWRRSEAFVRLSTSHSEAAARLHPPRQHGPIPRADWHDQLGRKYRAAAARPWLPVPRDPPPPE